MLIETMTDSSEAIPTVHIRFKTQDGVVLNEYSCTQDQYVLSLLDSEMREYRKLEFKRFKGLKPKLIYDRTETPVLPTACVKHVWLSQAKKQQLIFVEVAKQQWDVPFFIQDEVYKRVGFPRLIFGYFLRKKKVACLYCLAVKEQGRITDATELYDFPYANVSGGKVCMGGNVFPEIECLSDLSTYHNLFFSAPSTMCMYSLNKNLSGISHLATLYEKMQNQDFPEDWLRSSEITFGEFVSRIKATKY